MVRPVTCFLWLTSLLRPNTTSNMACWSRERPSGLASSTTPPDSPEELLASVAEGEGEGAGWELGFMPASLDKLYVWNKSTLVSLYSENFFAIPHIESFVTVEMICLPWFDNLYNDLWVFESPRLRLYLFTGLFTRWSATWRQIKTLYHYILYHRATNFCGINFHLWKVF